MENKASAWFSEEVIFHRYVSVILWTALIQLATITAVMLSTSLIFSMQSGLLSAMLHFSISIVLTVLFAILHIHNYGVVSRNALSVLEAGKMRFSPKRWFSVVMFTVLSACSIHCFGSIFGGFSLHEHSVLCSTNGENCCLSEKYFFNVIHGLYVGVIFGFTYFSSDLNCLEFPAIEQLKFPTCKMKAKEVIMHSASTVFKHLKWFYLLYYIIGKCTSVVSNSFCNSSGQMNLLWVTWISAVVLHVIWSSFIVLFQIFMMEHYYFQIETVLEKDAHKTLNCALQCTNPPILQLLACRDFAHLSLHSARRRSKLFQISNPGGHPLQWNSICSQSLKLIDTFYLKLVESSTGVTNRTVRQNETPRNRNSTSRESEAPNTQSLYETPTRDASTFLKRHELSTSLSSPVTSRRPFIKNLARPIESPNGQYVFNEWAEARENVYPINFSIISDWFSAKFQQLTTKLDPLVKYFVTETSEAKMERLFLDSQPVIWVTQGMCFMVQASFREDTYGVVQRWLPEIIAKLLDLQIALERSQKILTKKQSQAKRGAMLKQSMRLALSTGLYCIVCTFKQHLGDIKLTDEHRQRLQQYENFMA